MFAPVLLGTVYNDWELDVTEDKRGIMEKSETAALPKENNTFDGIAKTKLKHWTDIHKIVAQLLDLPNYVYRGHRMDNWCLEPTLTRMLKTSGDIPAATANHLKTFKYAIRGRRGLNPPVLKKKALWALGQHNGLATPLLDWSLSPYVAIFFAFAELITGDQTGTRVIFALNETRVKNKAIELRKADPNADIIKFHRPLSDENARLVNQNGLFTISPVGISIEDWIVTNFKGSKETVLAKIFIPDEFRIVCLKALDKMNINYATLFPDLEGASKYSNMKYEIENTNQH